MSVYPLSPRGSPCVSFTMDYSTLCVCVCVCVCVLVSVCVSVCVSLVSTWVSLCLIHHGLLYAVCVCVCVCVCVLVSVCVSVCVSLVSTCVSFIMDYSPLCVSVYRSVYPVSPRSITYRQSKLYVMERGDTGYTE